MEQTYQHVNVTEVIRVSNNYINFYSFNVFNLDCVRV